MLVKGVLGSDWLTALVYFAMENIHMRFNRYIFVSLLPYRCVLFRGVAIRFTGASWCTDIRRPPYISVHWHKCIAIHWLEKQCKSPRKKTSNLYWLATDVDKFCGQCNIMVTLPWYFIWFCYIFNTYDVVNIIISTINSNSYCDQPGCGR